MKKCFYLIVFMALFTISDCFALSNNSKLYEVGWGEAGVDVFATDVTTGGMDYNGWIIKSNNDSSTYYCIEPENGLQFINNAQSNTHMIYTDEEMIINNSRLTRETYERIKLLAYYGYGYKNHTDKKWYGITQVLIWRTVRGDISWQFRNSRFDYTINNNMYDGEISEIENLVSKHNLLPSFNESEIRLIKNEEVVLTDTNNVISNYVVNNTDEADFKIDGDKLTIIPKKEGKIDVNLSKEKVNNDFSLYASNKYQDIITRGDITSNEGKISLNILDHEVYGVIKISKLKGGAGEEFSKEEGATFSIYTSDGEFIRNITTDGEGIAKTSLKYGKYIIKQVNGEENYNFVTDFEVDVLEEKEYFYELKNERLSKLILYKKDYSSDITLAGAEFNLYKDDGTLIYNGTTNSDGYLEVLDLPIGKYYIEEVASPKYYNLNENKLYFDVLEYGKVIELSFTDERLSGKLSIYKTDGVTNLPLSGAEFEIYDYFTGSILYTGPTDDKGMIIIDDILGGKYYLKEIKAPDGYSLNTEKIEFEINDDVLVHINVTNDKMDNPYTGDSILTYIILLFVGMFSFISIIACYLYKNKSSKI